MKFNFYDVSKLFTSVLLKICAVEHLCVSKKVQVCSKKRKLLSVVQKNDKIPRNISFNFMRIYSSVSQSFLVCEKLAFSKKKSKRKISFFENFIEIFCF